MEQKTFSRRALRAGRIRRIDSILKNCSLSGSVTYACVVYDDGLAVVSFVSVDKVHVRDWGILSRGLNIGQLECFVAGLCAGLGVPFSLS